MVQALSVRGNFWFLPQKTAVVAECAHMAMTALAEARTQVTAKATNPFKCVGCKHRQLQFDANDTVVIDLGWA